MTQPLVSEPCDTPDRVTIFMNVTDRPYFGRFLTTIADADERRMTTRRYRRRRRSNGRSRTYPVTCRRRRRLVRPQLTARGQGRGDLLRGQVVDCHSPTIKRSGYAGISLRIDLSGPGIRRTIDVWDPCD